MRSDGLMAMHSTVWKNQVSTLEQLVANAHQVDVHDKESGWTPLHKAFFLGRMVAAGILLEAGAQLNCADHQGRTPLDLLSTELKAFLTVAPVGEAYSWGNGANYQLGSGAVGLQETPVRLEGLHGLSLSSVSAAKFHSAAVTQDGQLYTWGFGRGGRLGHGDFHIHSGESAVILPQQVAFFARKRVARVVASKHHTAAVTASGELFTWGSNREGRLGYQAADTQPTPRKITTFNRQKVVDVAVANRHTVALLDDGCVFSWGCNLQGQLGYGTSDSASNALPRIVEAMKGKRVKAVAAAKRHTVVLTEEGSVYTWGHRIVTPKRVVLAGARDVARHTTGAVSKGWEVVFHKGQSEVGRPEAVLIAAGAAHSSAVTRDGVVLAWRSMDPALRPQEVGGPLAGKSITAISAGKYRTAVVTDEGEVYMWEGWSKAAEAVPKRTPTPSMPGTSPPEVPPEWDMPKGSRSRKSGKALAFQRITPLRVEGLRRITGVAVGEKHSLALQSWCSGPPSFAPPPLADVPQAAGQDTLLSPRGSEASALNDADCLPSTSGRAAAEGVGVESDAYWEDLEGSLQSSPPTTPEKGGRRNSPGRHMGLASLQRLCERAVATNLVEPRSVLQVLEFADAAGSQALKQHCVRVALSNLDLVLLEGLGHFQQLLPHLLEELERQWCRRFPRATGPPSSEDQEGEPCPPSPSPERASGSFGSGSGEDRPFQSPHQQAEAAHRARQERTLRKKLQQIEALEGRAEQGVLDSQQLAKLAMRPVLQTALQALQRGQSLNRVRVILEGCSPSASTPTPVPSGKSARESPAARQGGRKARGGAAKEDASPPATEPLSVRMGVEATPPKTAASSAAVSSAVSSAVKNFSNRSQETSAEARAGNANPPDTGGSDGPPSGQRGKGSPVWRGPTPQQGFAAPPQPPPTWGGADGEAGREERTPGAAKTPGSSAKKPARRKGGLSMFLAGQLEGESKPPTPPPLQQRSPISWAQQGPSVATSLREIQSQESSQGVGAAATPAPRLAPSPASRNLPASRLSDDGSGKLPAPSRPWQNSHPPRSSDDGESATPTSGITIALGDLMRKSKPIAVAAAAEPRSSEPERRGPAWGGANTLAGASPTGQTRLQDIQAEQELRRENSARSWGASGASPGSHKASFLLGGGAPSWRQSGSLSQSNMAMLGTSPSTGFPAGTSPSSRRSSSLAATQPPSKWYIKDEQEVVPLRCIQTEEFAMKELSAMFGAEASASAPQPISAATAPKPRPSTHNTPRSRARRGSPASKANSNAAGSPAVDFDDRPPGL